MAITCTSQELVSRLNKISKILRPLLPNGRRLGGIRINRGIAKEFIITTKISETAISDHRESRFKTYNDEYLGNYFEIWQLDGNEIWKMKSAYLNFYYNDENILSLHCDPGELKSAKHFKYKCGPHLHISDKHSVFCSAHIALSLSNYESVINSITELELAFANAVEMIRDEFIPSVNAIN